MVKPVRFGSHAVKKFDDLRRYKVIVTRDPAPAVATGRFTEHLVLRVIYRETDDAFEIVTF